MARKPVTIDDLQDELLLQVFVQLSRVPPVTNEEDTALYERRLPFHTFESPGEQHPGLRAYPFLAQVCRRWRALLRSEAAQAVLWRELVLDFGHEIITSVHTPVAWSDRRPTDEEFRTAFAATRLNANRITQFVRVRRGCIHKLVLMHSEGYWADENEFVNLTTKHNFGLAHFGLMLGLLGDTLEELRIVHCNDLFGMGSPLGAVASLQRLRTLAVEDYHCRLYREPVAELGRLTSLESLSLCAMARNGLFVFGIDSIPDTWQQLRRLKALELRGNALIESLPDWMPAALPELLLLDISYCHRLDLSALARFTQLEVLSLQGLGLYEEGRLPKELAASIAQGAPPPHTAPLPRCIFSLPSLTALNLADNVLGEVPADLGRLRRLRHLDLSGNAYLKVLRPASFLLQLTSLVWLDLRGILVERGEYWTPDKCQTMQNVAALAKALRRKRRRDGVKVLYDTS